MTGRMAALLLLLITVAGCARASSLASADPSPVEQKPTPPPSATSALAAPEGRLVAGTRTDEQGAVTFAVTPLGSEAALSDLAFEVVMDTHSIDLSWDLARLSVLRTDQGRQVPASGWPLGSGHHYQGVLTFPSALADGTPVLDGASQVTLIIAGTDVAERRFTWEVAR